MAAKDAAATNNPRGFPRGAAPIGLLLLFRVNYVFGPESGPEWSHMVPDL